jgi:hypothetical protein
LSTASKKKKKEKRNHYQAQMKFISGDDVLTNNKILKRTYLNS